MLMVPPVVVIGVVNSYPAHASSRTGPRSSTGSGGGPKPCALTGLENTRSSNAAPSRPHLLWAPRLAMSSTDVSLC
jgi:hypothetical protein